MRPRRLRPAWILWVALLYLPSSAGATAEFCAVNTITREGAVFEEGEYVGIGWRAVGERSCAAFEGHLAALGYRRTTARHRIEWAIAAVGLLSAAGAAALLLRRRARRRAARP